MNKKDKEQHLIDRLNSNYIGDDAAVVDGLIYSTDAFFEDVHFKREWMSLAQIARKAMLVNISDAIAMNAKPLYALVTISLPSDIVHKEIDEIVDTLLSTAAEFGCEIIGGDTIGAQKLNISITIISKSDNPLYRIGLEEGDLLAFTGTLGESKRDMDRLFSGEKISSNSRFYEPTLRGKFIAKAREFLSAGMDISDGLFCDTNKLLNINKFGFNILENINDNMGLSGEEYEMLIGFKKTHLNSIKKIAQAVELELTVFAEVTKNSNQFGCKKHHFN